MPWFALFLRRSLRLRPRLLMRASSVEWSGIRRGRTARNRPQPSADIRPLFHIRACGGNEAAPIARMSYDELMELSHFGAKVVHPPSVHPARSHGIRL